MLVSHLRGSQMVPLIVDFYETDRWVIFSSLYSVMLLFCFIQVLL